MHLHRKELLAPVPRPPAGDGKAVLPGQTLIQSCWWDEVRIRLDGAGAIVLLVYLFAMGHFPKENPQGTLRRGPAGR